MTTIIGDAKRSIIVSDTMMSDSDSNTKDLDFRKVVKFKDGWLAVAGDVRNLEKVRRWLNDSTLPKPEIKEEFDCDFMKLTPDGLFVTDRHLDFWECVTVDALGSGSGIALGAMKLGHKAEDAVWAATQVDVNSGGKVMVYSLDSSVGKEYIRKAKR